MQDFNPVVVILPLWLISEFDLCPSLLAEFDSFSTLHLAA
jgi:hypothetical protein